MDPNLDALKPVHLCVEGTKGAGKTTTIKATTKLLEAAGWEVTVHSLFQEGNEWAKTRGFAGGVPMMEAGPAENAAIVGWLMERESQVRIQFFRARDPRRILISDRGWITMHAYLYTGAWARAAKDSVIDTRPERWNHVLKATPPTVFIHTPPETTLKRRAGMLDAVSGLQTDARLQADYERRMKLAREYHVRVVRNWETNDTAFVDLAPRVVQVVERLHRGLGAGRE